MTNQAAVLEKYADAHYVTSGHRAFIRAYRDEVPFTLVETRLTEDTWAAARALIEGQQPQDEPETLPRDSAEAAFRNPLPNYIAELDGPVESEQDDVRG